MPVKSNFNFVPAPEEKEVFKPDWSTQVSHDIPFSDGECGEIHLRIEAKTPIFIRDGHQANQKTEAFFHIKKDGQAHFLIPATALKGMTRNVLEILSKSRLRKINDHRYSFRDLSNGSLYKEVYSSADVKCGWLLQDENENWIIEDCGEPLYITHEKIDELCNTHFSRIFDNAKQQRLDKKFKSAIHKYRELKNKTGKFFKKINYDGTLGTLIFTGQPGLRNHLREKGKNGEFVFPNRIKNSIEVPADKQREFRFIYLDHDENNISPEWKYWRNQLNQKEKTPVFFTTDKVDESQLRHFGLAFMYKLPFENSTQKVLPYKDYQFEEMDLAETIFGSVDYLQGALKGRVFFSNAFALMDNVNHVEKPYEEILAGPKASYYPFYLEQDDPTQRYSTYMEEEAVLRGFKRYPRQKGFKGGSYTEIQLRNKKVFSRFWPLDAGTVFEGKIRFHNLRPEELGALLSALTLHGSTKSVHSLGAAKPYGCGVVKIKTTLLEEGLNKTQDEYLALFEKLMGGEAWLHSPALTELATMTQLSDESLAYPEKPKTFVEYKNAKQYLLPYSQIVQSKNIPRFPSIQERLDRKDQALILNGKKLDEIKKEMGHLGYGLVPQAHHAKLKELLIEICKKHNPSKNKLTRKPFDQSYEWKNTLSEWFGESQARIFYEELQVHFPPKPPQNEQ